jgi:hypothetical protein
VCLVDYLWAGSQNASVISEPSKASLFRPELSRHFSTFQSAISAISNAPYTTRLYALCGQAEFPTRFFSIMALPSINPPTRVLIRTRLTQLQKIDPSFETADTKLIKKLCDKLSITGETKNRTSYYEDLRQKNLPKLHQPRVSPRDRSHRNAPPNSSDLWAAFNLTHQLEELLQESPRQQRIRQFLRQPWKAYPTCRIFCREPLNSRKSFRNSGGRRYSK